MAEPGDRSLRILKIVGSRRAWAVVAGLMLFTACRVDPPYVREEPPPVTIRFFDRSIELVPYTYCYGNVCAEGFPPAHPPDVGSPDEVVVQFPLEGWSFTGGFRPAGEECGRWQQAALQPARTGEFLLHPVGYSGTYDVELFGRGEGGDLFVMFRWTTPIDGPLPRPEARLALLANPDGKVDSYGVELEVNNLATSPKEALARITVRSDEGQAMTFEPTPARPPCLSEGTVYWDGPDEEGRAAAALSGKRFTYEVELTLDGIRYVATAAWPADEIVGYEPSVALQFSPGLPALS
jgi:hypothetical protein